MVPSGSSKSFGDGLGLTQKIKEKKILPYRGVTNKVSGSLGKRWAWGKKGG